MEFTEATDRIISCCSLRDVAEALGVSHSSVKQARLPEESTGYRRPPPRWRATCARLARKRAAERLHVPYPLPACAS